METNGGKKKSSSTIFYEAPLGYSIEDVRPHGGIKKFKSAAYSNGYLMGRADTKKWHIYTACAEAAKRSDAVYTVEMCMTGLDRKRASVFYSTQSSSAVGMTEESGIRRILPDSEICDFQFDPCGYVMNAIKGDAISAIHVTPEDGFSYASFEATGYDFKVLKLNYLLERVLTCFQPTEFSVAFRIDGEGQGIGINITPDVQGYSSIEKSYQVLGKNESIIYLSYMKPAGCTSPTSTLQCWREINGEEVVK